MLQALAYPKTQSFVDTFQAKASSASSSLRNFQCMAELLYWLACLYDPTIFPANFKFGVKQESDRIQFVNFLVNELYTRGNIQLNAIHLYKADGSTIVELIKIASPLYKAINQDYDETCTELKESRLFNFIVDESIQHIGHCASQMSQLGTNIDRKSLGDWSSQIEMRTVHLETLHPLAVSSAVGTQSNAAGNAVQQDIKKLLDSVLYDVNHLQKKCRLLGLDEKDIFERIKQASTDIITKHSQLESLQGTKPVFMDEYTEIETELQEYYRMFVTNAQNVYFLKKEMEANNDARFHWKAMAMTDRMDPPLNGDYPAVKSDDEQRGEDSHHVTEISIKDDHTSSNLPQKSRSKIALDTGSEKADSMTAFSRGGLSSSNVSSVSESIADDESFNNNIESDCNTDDSGVQNDPDLSSDDDF